MQRFNVCLGYRLLTGCLLLVGVAACWRDSLPDGVRVVGVDESAQVFGSASAECEYSTYQEVCSETCGYDGVRPIPTSTEDPCDPFKYKVRPFRCKMNLAC
jgi:hypothetical protein